MSFKRTYSDDTLTKDIIGEILVKCSQCSNKDVLGSKGKIEYTDNGFINDTSILPHEPCDVCGSDNWVEHKSVVILSKISLDKYTDLETHIEEIESVSRHLELLQREDFHIVEDTTDKYILAKELD